MIQIDIRKLPRSEYERYTDDLLSIVGLSEFKNAYASELSGGACVNASASFEAWFIAHRSY